MGVSNVISLLSGVAMFLFGMMLMGDGLKKVAGSKLELILYKLTSNPLKGVLLGTGVTAVIQSSSATSVMVVGFVNARMMNVRQAISIILGAIFGTSITGWIICLSDIGGGSGWVELLSTSVLTGVIAVIGVILVMFCKGDTQKHLGNILMGFAVLMFGMQMMSGAVAPLRESAAFVEILTRFSNPLLGILVGCLFTCILQSASAAVGILQALAVTGAVDFSVALPIVMGIAIGAAVPVLISALGASVAGKRTAFVYLLIDLLGVLIWGSIFYTANAIWHFSFLSATMDMFLIAEMNTVFRFLTVLSLTPLIPLIEKLVCAILPDKADEQETAEIDRLEERFIEHPTLAVEQSRQAICSMARKTAKNLSRAFALLANYSEAQFATVQEKEEIIDRYEDKLGTYIVKITQRELTHDQNKELSKFLHTISDFERIGDHAANIADVAKEISQKKLQFSFEGKRELDTLTAAVGEIVHISFTAFTTGDLDLAYRVEPLEECIDGLCDEVKMHHIQRVQGGNCTLNQGFVFNDLLTNYERIADHCSNIAVAMIELEADSFDTHEYLESLKNARTEGFNRYFEEYRVKFAL